VENTLTGHSQWPVSPPVTEALRKLVYVKIVTSKISRGNRWILVLCFCILKILGSENDSPINKCFEPLNQRRKAMKQRKVLFGALFVLAVFVSSLAAGTGVVIVTTHTTTAQPEDKTTNKTYVDSDRMRMETQAMGGMQIVIFRQDKGLFWIIDQKGKTYMEITKQDFQQMKAKMNEAKAMMDERMKSLPPEQRQMMEKMMQGRGMPAMQPAGTIKTTYKKVASGEKVNQWVCAKYEGYREDNKVKEVWTTDWKSLGLTPESFKVMKDLGEFFEDFAKDMASSFDKIGSEEWEKEQGYSGIPVKTLSYADGKLRAATEVTEVKQESLSAALFDLPEGLTKKEMPYKQMPPMR
jgi:hypothetical protein